jgi:hypothetical protein
MIAPVAGQLDPLTEIEYRARYLLDDIDVPRAELEQELRGIAEAAEREQAYRAEFAERLARIEARLGIRPQRPALRLVRGGDD